MGAEQQRSYIDSLKRETIATRSALAANGVVLRDVVAFYRVLERVRGDGRDQGPAAAELARHPRADGPAGVSRDAARPCR